MKIKLPIVDLTNLLSDEEMEDLGLPSVSEDEIDYKSLPVTYQIFYEVHGIRAINDEYSALCIGGYEWTIKLPLKELEAKIDKQKRIIISDN